MDNKVELSDTYETEKRQREVQLVVNIIEPDPEYQPLFISDEACFFDVSGKAKQEMEESLRFYFKGDIPAPLTTPLWQFIDRVKLIYPGWPDEWPPEN